MTDSDQNVIKIEDVENPLGSSALLVLNNIPDLVTSLYSKNNEQYMNHQLGGFHCQISSLDARL